MKKSTSHNPPVAKRKPQILEIHGDQREDPYYWLKDRENPEVIEYLEAENCYHDAVMRESRDLQDRIYEELRSRIVETDTSAPVKYGPYEYYYKSIRGENYLSHYRRLQGDAQTEELLLDENELASKHSFFVLRNLKIDPSHKLLAYSVDTKGNENYTIHFLNLAEKKLLPDTLTNSSGEIAWSNSGECVYYTTLNQANRPYRLFRHCLGKPSEKDELLFEEPAEEFYIRLSKTDSSRFIYLGLGSINTSEVHLLDANNDTGMPRLVFPRKYDVEYSVEDRNTHLYVLTNEDAVNFRFMKTSLANPDKTSWQTIIAHSEDSTLTDFQVFENFIAVAERYKGLPTIRFLGRDNSEYRVKKPSRIQELRIGINLEFDSTICRVNGNSIDMPFSQYDFDMKSGEGTLVKSKPVGGKFDLEDYQTEQHAVISHDGTEIPLFLVYRKDTRKNGPAPVLLNGYGSYGYSYPLHFSSSRLSLLDRGIVFAISHIRGGGELGQSWYHNGKLCAKKNTFKDFTACANFLFDQGITDPDHLAIGGGSAGGLVVGNFLNAHPNSCKAAVAHVPFVDILTTILDDTLPLSVLERDEWGDPNERLVYDYIKSYSPYDNIRNCAFPALLITAGINDKRVGYWEPAKWAAKIRFMKTNNSPLLLKTEMSAGHGGKSARYDAMRDTAQEYAFIVNQIATDISHD